MLHYNMTSEANSYISLWQKLNIANPPSNGEDPSIIHLYRRAKKSFIDRKIQYCLRQEWELGQGLTPNEQILKSHTEDLRYKILQKKANFRNDSFIYVTVSPPPSVTVEKILKVASTQAKRVFVKNYWYVIEQRGENSENFKTGIHLHFLIERDLTRLKPCKVIKRLKNGFGQLFPIKNKIRIFNEAQLYAYSAGYQHSIDLDYAQSKLCYMLGFKIDPKKHLKQPYDLLLRHQLNIPNIFTNLEINYQYNPEIKMAAIN